jgi:hypothetical protein
MSFRYINPARNGGVFYLIFKMSVGYVKSNFELQNLRLWQDIWTFECVKTISRNAKYFFSVTFYLKTNEKI